MSLAISFDRPTYSAGDQVNGIVTFIVNLPTGGQKIDLEMRGIAESRATYKWTETIRRSRYNYTEKRYETYYEYIDHYDPQEQRSTIWDSSTC